MFEFVLWRHMPDWVLKRYREGSLDQTRTDALEGHLLLCPTCQMQMEDLLPYQQPLIAPRRPIDTGTFAISRA